MKQPHVDSPNSFRITAKTISLENAFKVRSIPFFLLQSVVLPFTPAVVSRPRNTGYPAQFFYTEAIIRVVACFLNCLKPFYCFALSSISKI